LKIKSPWRDPNALRTETVRAPVKRYHCPSFVRFVVKLKARENDSGQSATFFAQGNFFELRARAF
jgi:hypothetical protein